MGYISPRQTLRNRSFLPVIIAIIGASIIFPNGPLAVFDPSPEKVRPVFETAGGMTLGGVFFDYQYLAILVVTALLVGLQYVFFECTLLSKKMQATSQDKDMARLQMILTSKRHILILKSQKGKSLSQGTSRGVPYGICPQG